MKNTNIKFRFILTLVLTIGVVSSCKDYLNVNPVTSVGPDVVFSDVANATKAVMGAYSALGGDNGYGIRITMYYPYDNDEMMGQGGTPYPDNERRDLAHYRVQSSNTQLATPFNQLYIGIERANICIYYIPKMSGYSGDAELKRLHGEALTLRAQYYYELIRNWGDVPAQYEPSSFEKDLFKPREDRNKIYDKILADLADAAALVPWRSQVGTADERITQGAVRGIRARIALSHGGYSLKDGAMVRVSNYKDYYQIARDECNAIITSGEHKLNPSFKSIWKDAITAHALEPNGEILFQIGMTGGSSGSGDSKLAYYNGPRVNSNGNGALTILPTYFYLFEPNDSRRDVTCAPYDVNLNNTFAARPLVTMVDGKFRRDWITNPVPSPTSTQQYFGLSWPILRYSDVLLMFAEAENEINNAPTAAATAAFTQVRTRAYGANPIGTVPIDYTGFFNAIVVERSLELGGEGIRKYDLLRWNMLASKLTATKQALTDMANGTGNYTVGSLPPSVGTNATLPTTMYYLTALTTAAPSGFVWATSLYSQGAQPGSTTAVTWRQTTGINNTLMAFYAVDFVAGKSELLPLATSVLDSNPSLVQNPGF